MMDNPRPLCQCGGMKLSLLLTLGSSLLLLATTPFAAGQNLLKNGNFDAELNEWVKSYSTVPIKVADEGSNHYLVLVSDDPKIGASVTQGIKVQPGQWYECTGRIRVKSITPGEKNFQNARVQLSWKDTADKDVTPWPPSASHVTPTDDWVPFDLFLRAPIGAVKLNVAPAIFGATGEAAFDDLTVKSANELDVPQADRNRYK